MDIPKVMYSYLLSLGSNMGDRSTNLKLAAEFLGTIGNVLRISSIYETRAVGMEKGTRDFYNMAVSVSSPFAPREFLVKIKGYEKDMGRDILHSHNLPRIIDIDILLANECILSGEKLVIPHPEMTKRAFVLIPLAEIAPDALHPIIGKTVKKILSGLAPCDGVKRIDDRV